MHGGKLRARPWLAWQQADGRDGENDGRDTRFAQQRGVEDCSHQRTAAIEMDEVGRGDEGESRGKG